MVIVMGYIPSPEGRAALEAAIEEARQRGARLIVVNASRGDALVDARFAQDDEWAGVEQRLADSGVEHELAQMLHSEDPADQVLHAAEDAGADLIVIGLRRRTPVGKLILGSVAQRILLEAECPVYAVKAPVSAGRRRRQRD